ncbi:unnamed protein product [Brassica napus]|uniref:peptidylprolyl isomerase n=1 Tax=Brassica napus TaxID=3708 RepID=A0A816VKB7_BRANA|nr:unnamed protein product [Brassica napus]
MDSTDDDFGELYVDDKAHATAFLAGDDVCEESEHTPILPGENKGFEVTEEPESRLEAKKLDDVDKDSSPCVDNNACAANRTEAKEESEYSDSDDDDDLNIVLKEDDSVACGSNASNQRRSVGSWCTMPNSGMVVNGRMTMEDMNPSLGMPQCGYNNFSHTWSRANFHGFEKKPWRNPGVDVNDYFNFGFNEQSWKDYCNPGLKGRAIEVEGGTLGRTPSMDLRYPRELDPDVVIQIPVTADVEELSSMTPVEAGSLSKPSNGESRSEEFHSDIGEDLHSSGDSMKEEVSVGCEDEYTGSFRGEQSTPKENCRRREVTPCDKEVIEEEKEETCWSSDKADSSSVESESSHRDRFRFSPTSSYSVGKTEESEDPGTESSKDGAIDDQREASTPPRRTRFAEHEANSTKCVERSDTGHSRHRRSHEDSSKRHYGRVDYEADRRTKHADASRIPDRDLGKKVCYGRGRSYRDSSRNWQNRPYFTLGKVGTEGRGLPHSDREKRLGRSYSPVDLDRDRGQRIGWRNNKEPSHGRGFDPSNGYKYEAGLKEYTSRSSFNPSQRNSRVSLNKEEDRYGRQHCERRYGRERSPARAYESNKEDRYGRQHCERKYSRERSPGLAYERNKERRPYYQDRIPISDMECRYQFEYCSINGRHNPNQSREDEPYYGRRCDYDYDFPRGRYEDEVQRTESGIPFELAYREMHSFAEVGRREFERYEEDFSEIDRRHHYTTLGWHHDRFVSDNDGHNKYRVQGAWPTPSLPFRDSWQTKGSRGDSWRDETRDFTKREANDRQNNLLYKDAPRDGWTRNLVRGDNVSIQDRLRYDDDDDNWVRRDKRRYQLGDSVREIAHSEHPSYTDEMLVTNIGVSAHDRISIKQRPGYFMSHVHETVERHQRSKKLRRDGNAFIKCQDPIDSTGRQGKLANQSRIRFSNGRDTTEQQGRQKPRKVMGKGNEKAVVKIKGLIEKEEGEIIQEEERKVTGTGIDEERIQESIKKMERRRERFKEPELVAAKFHFQTEQEAKTDVTNQKSCVSCLLLAMARIKPQALLNQSKKKKGPSRISISTIVVCNLVVAVVVLSLVTTYRHWSQRSRNAIETQSQRFEDTNAASEQKSYDLPGYADISTSKGLITVELFKDASPEAVDRFLDLCQKDHFKGMPFHRVIKNYLVQAGHSQSSIPVEEWTSKGKLRGRLNTSPKHEAFMLGTPKTKGNNNNKDFELLITTAPIPDLNDQLIVFGRVLKGEDVVQEIEEVDTDEHYQPKSQIGIISVILKREL